MNISAIFQHLSESSGLDARFLSQIEKWLHEAPDNEVFRINLVEWSERRGVPVEKAVEHFLHLTVAGVLDISWDSHCPQCNVVLSRDGSLRAVGPVHHCKFCIKDVESRMDDHFEVTFGVNPQVRQVSGRVRYEPSDNVEIFLREKIHPGEEIRAKMTVPASVGHLRFVAWPPVIVQAVQTAPAADQTVIFYGGESARFPEHFPTGEIEFPIRNDSRQEITLMVENHDMREYLPQERKPRLTGLQVINVPAFRELFATETLSTRESLKVRDVSLVFTDIKGSTELYQRVGDVQAYNLVRDHFDILFDTIGKNGGTVVKTIGDAVMASFLTPDAAVRAMMAAQTEFTRFNQRTDVPSAIMIRAGIHKGPAVVVTLNGRLDFFGTTVNEAARIEGQCLENQLLLSDAVIENASVKAQLDRIVIESFETPLKGLSKSYRLHRVKLG